MLISGDLHKKSSEVFIKTRSPPASLSFKGQETKHTTVKWSITSSTTRRTACENVNSRFCNQFSVILNRFYACKMRLAIQELNWYHRFGDKKKKIVRPCICKTSHFSSSIGKRMTAKHTDLKKKSTCKACKSAVFFIFKCANL